MSVKYVKRLAHVGVDVTTLIGEKVLARDYDADEWSECVLVAIIDGGVSFYKVEYPSGYTCMCNQIAVLSEPTDGLIAERARAWVEYSAAVLTHVQTDRSAYDYSHVELSAKIADAMLVEFDLRFGGKA